MSTDRLGELRAALLHHILATVPEGATERTKCAQERFDSALIQARRFHAERPEEDKDVHLGGLMHIFDEVGIPHLEALPVIEEFVLTEK